MFKTKRHVGRPSNEELKRRRNKKILLFSIPIILVVIIVAFISSNTLSKLMGNSVVADDYYCEDSSYELRGTECIKTTVKKSGLYADVNSDEVIDDNDLNILNNYVKDNNSVSLTPLQLKAADINSDGMVSELDVQILESNFTKVSGSGSSYSERIGIERICEGNDTLNGNDCINVQTISAKKKIVNKKNDDESIGSKTNNSIENNNVQNQASTPVIVSLKPEDDQTNLKVNRTYRINVDFDIKDTSKQYYYIWTNYLYGEVNYKTECKPVIQGEHGGGFKVTGPRKVNVRIYSDSSCKTEISSTESKDYTCDGCQNMVNVSFKPQDDNISAPYNTKYKLNVNFDVNDTSRDYYYVWSAYLNGVKNSETKCTKITPGEHYGSIHLNGKRIVNVTVYSDSSCKNKIRSFSSKQYVCSDCDKSVDVELKPQDKKTSFVKGTKYKMNVNFQINDTSKDYYYIWYSFLNGTNNSKTKCTKITNGEHYGSFTVDGTKKVQVMIYSDSSCQSKIKTVSSDTYKCSNCAPLSISIGKNLSSSQTKGTIIHNSVKFNLMDKSSPQYYYVWRTYTDGLNTYTSDCQKVVYGRELVKDLTINGTRKGTITVYTDNKCKNRLSIVPIAETTTYTCSNCYSEPEQTTSGSDWSNYWSSIPSEQSSSKSGKTSQTCTWNCPLGYDKIPGGPQTYCIKLKYYRYEYVCPVGEKAGDGPSATCIKPSACSLLKYKDWFSGCPAGKYYNPYSGCYSSKGACQSASVAKLKTVKKPVYEYKSAYTTCK